jgi:hypothetical protein
MAYQGWESGAALGDNTPYTIQHCELVAIKTTLVAHVKTKLTNVVTGATPVYT